MVMTAACCVLLCLGNVLAATDPEAAVASGRKALDHWVGGYPWYDARTDDLRPVDVSEPWVPQRQPGSFSLNLEPLLRWLAWILLVLFLAALAYVLVRVYLSRTRGGSPDGDDAGPSDAADRQRRSEALPLPAARLEGDLLAQARRHYREGRFGEAILYLFGYQLVELDKRQRIRLAKGKTNRQYLREIGGPGRLRRLVEQTMVAFEDFFFGRHAIDRARFESCWSRLAEFDSLAAEGTP